MVKWFTTSVRKRYLKACKDKTKLVCIYESFEAKSFLLKIYKSKQGKLFTCEAVKS